MKKEILDLVKSEEGVYRLNNISKLHRWTKTALDETVDKLRIEFDTINDVDFGLHSFEIESREYDGIIAECEKAIKTYLEEVAQTLIKNLKAGYKNQEH